MKNKKIIKKLFTENNNLQKEHNELVKLLSDTQAKIHGISSVLTAITAKIEKCEVL